MVKGACLAAARSTTHMWFDLALELGTLGMVAGRALHDVTNAALNAGNWDKPQQLS